MVGRSEACPCGSGKKYKRCCGAGVPAGQDALSGFLLAHQMYMQRRYREAEQVCERALLARPGEADGWFLRAACALEQQAYDRAEVAMQRAASLAPRRPEVHFNLGHIHERRGDAMAAIAAYREAVRLAPDYGQAWNNLGNALRGVGRIAQAAEAYRETARLTPNAASAWNNLGVAQRAAGELEQAGESYARAIARDPRYAPAHGNLGNLQAARGDHGAAEASLREALRLDPGFADAQLNLAALLRDTGRFEPAVAACREALRLQPTSDAAWAMFAQSLQGVRFTADDTKARAELAAALRHDAVDPLSLVPTAVSLLKHTPGLLPLLRDDDRSAASMAAWYADPLLGAMLENAVIADWDIENALCRVRAHLLATSCLGEAWPAAARDFAAKLAQQCLLTDHVYEESAQDASRLEALQQKLEASLASDQEPAPQQVLAYACYRPLTALRNADRLRATHPVLAPVLAAHLAAPREEARLRTTLPRLGTVNDAVSRAVQAQYESHPYPRWARVGMQGAQPLAQVLHAIAPRATLPATLDAQAPQALVAGCGTGRHPIQTATRIAGAQVLAVDLSGASLGYAMRKARELAVASLEFMQADILELGQLERRFDLIESFGVLHHMRDPEAGWRVLCGLAKPGALMVIGLYSERARAPVVACRAQVRERGYGSDADSIRRFRQDLMRDGDPQVAALIRNSPDFYSVSDCRDLLFHVQEHRYTLPLIAAMGERLGLVCLGLELDDRALYATDGSALPEPADLAGWDRYEQAQPQAFGSTYKIWWQKPA